MKNQLLVTAFGEDRPGIVARVSEVFLKNGANLEESRMTILGGEFAAIVLVSIPAENIEGLKKDLEKLQSEAITVSTKITSALDPARFDGHHSYELILDGADHEGIVHRVSAFLRDRSINIQSMETEVVPAPETGTPLFRMKAHIMAPRNLNFSDVQNQLRSIGNEEAVDITVTEYTDQTGKPALQRIR